MTPEQWKNLPETLLVRHVKINVRIRGFRTRTLTVATTLCDAGAYPAETLAASPKNQRAAVLEAFLQCLAADTLPKRPNRIEPRARKRRPKNYQLLNKPRRQFQEIQHRNRYAKPLS
jgi:hypothetical protein